jgi:protoheme IX farnesyltransferase
MWLERDVDAQMARTRGRPLPAGRLAPSAALAFGALLVVAAIPLLLAVNLATAVLGSLALVLYVGAYTPLKRRTDLALLVGAIPGALPPLMGWVSASRAIDGRAMLLAGLLFSWQLVHVSAIAIVREADYRRAGLLVISVRRGRSFARRAVQAGVPLLVATSLALVPAGLAGVGYAVLATVAGCVLSWAVVAGDGDARWAWRAFLASNLYLVVLLVGLVADRACRPVLP